MTTSIAKFRWKISTRLACNTVIISTLALALFAYMTVQRLEHGVEQQKKEIEQLTNDRLVKRLDLHSKLIANELNHLKEDIYEVSLRLSSSAVLRRSVKNRNVVEIGSILKNMINLTEFGSLMVLDGQSRILAAHDPRLVKGRALSALKSMSKLARSRGLIQGNTASFPITYTGFEIGRETYLRAIGIETSKDELMVTSMFPMFDESGNTIGTLVGHRLITSADHSLEHIEESGVLGIRVLSAEKTILSAGLSGFGHQISHPVPHHVGFNKLESTLDGKQIYKCRPFHTGWRLCTHILETDYRKSIDQVVRFVRDQNYALIWWLIVLALIIVFLSVVSTWLVSLKILEPLNRITTVVHEVAKGNWLARVPSIKRADEVGEIARAVLVLQQSIKDRERLQSDVDNINEARSRETQLENELQNTQMLIRKRLFTLSDLAERLEQNNKKLTDLATDAVGEVDESRLVASRVNKALSNQQDGCFTNGGVGENDVVESIDRLGETLTTLYARTNGVSDDVNRLLHEAQSIDRIVKNLQVKVQDGSSPNREIKASNGGPKLIEIRGENAPPIDGNVSTT